MSKPDEYWPHLRDAGKPLDEAEKERIRKLRVAAIEAVEKWKRARKNRPRPS